MKRVTFGPLNFDDINELTAVAKIHESAPLNWDSSYEVTLARIHMWVDVFKKINGRSDVFLQVARDACNELVGFHWINIQVDAHAKFARIDSLWVSENVRQQGIGQKLKKNGEVWAKAQGATHLKTAVFYANQKMIEFNLKQGFEPQQLEMVKKI